MNNLRLCVTLLLAVVLLHCVSGDYELRVQFHSYRNPTSNYRTNNGQLRCCDGNGNANRCRGGERCDTYFFICLRQIGLSGNTGGMCLTPFIVTETDNDDDDINFGEEVLGQANPLLFVRQGTWEGIQFYTAVGDEDGGNDPDDLVDRFPIDLNSNILIPGADYTQQTTYNGFFGFGQLELSFQLVCAENFFGSDCATECIPQNSFMFCDDEGNRVCLPGWFGPNCDNCFQNAACGQNGQCVDGFNSFTCDCDDGFTGEFCQEVDDCFNNDVCGQNGQCVDGINTIACVCDDGFIGALCQEVDDCFNNDECGPNGQCVDGDDTFTCDCNVGFTGPRCLANIDDCMNGNCGQNQECVDLINDFSCRCVTGFTGPDCLTDIDDCEGIDCSNGQCQDTGTNSFICECDADFTGTNCESEIDDCMNVDCSGNGECIDEVTSFSCECDAGFTGMLCETNIDDCSSANCSENSQCVDGIESFTCECNPGFNGTFCENSLPQVNTPGNTSAIIGGVLGALFGTIALVLIVFLILVIAMRKSKQKEKGDSEVTVNTTLPGDNPTYASTWESSLPQTVHFHNDSNTPPVATTTAINGITKDETEREFDNPIYESSEFNTEGSLEPVNNHYAQPGPVYATLEADNVYNDVPNPGVSYQVYENFL